MGCLERCRAFVGAVPVQPPLDARPASRYGFSMSNTAAATRPISAVSSLTIPAAWLVGLLAGWLLLDQCLLWLFLGHVWLAVLAPVTLVLVRWFVGQSSSLGSIPLVRVGICFAFAAIILVLGGEGNWLYANTDWQVRDAVLRDMAINPWPFAYLQHGALSLLRAPLGMYLLPALAWKAGGESVGTITLLVQNSIMLGTLLALGSQLYDSAKARALALVVVVGFSGLDWLGNLLVGQGPLDHLEGWLPGLEFSSTITLAFWVPQHAFAGWLAGLAFMLHRAGKIGLAPFLAIIPLTALWSPLGLIGAMPWAALAGWRALRERSLHWRDFVLPAITSLIVLPCLSYLSAAGDSVGMQAYPVPGLYFLIFELIEVVPWLLPVLALNAQSRFGREVPLCIAAILIVLPHVQIGWGLDLMMRASIPTLTILAVSAADIVVVAPSWTKPGWHWWLAAVAVLGWPTGGHEIARAFAHPVSGYGSCNLLELWNLAGENIPNVTYVAPLEKTPHWLVAGRVTPMAVNHQTRCWDQPWYKPPDAPDVVLGQN